MRCLWLRGDSFKQVLGGFLLVVNLVFVPGLAGQGFEVPSLKAPVNDLAGMIDAPTTQTLNAGLLRLHRQGGAQIAVLTLPNLGGFSIEQASIQVVDKWQLGDASKDNGLLFLLVRDSRELRIEVGQGLEGAVPDALAKRIIAETMEPLFQQGELSAGILAGVAQVVHLAHPELNLAEFFDVVAHELSQAPPEEVAWWEVLIFAIVMMFLIFTPTGRALLLYMLMTGGSGGGRQSGGGSGGFGGGGGGFSGGGASGRW